MRKRFEFYWPIFNILGIILVLWSLTVVNVSPEHALKREALLDSTENDMIYEAEVKDQTFFEQKNPHDPNYVLVRKNTKLVINF